MALLAFRLFLDLKPAPASKVGTTLFVFAGFALAALSFTTDPTIRTTPSTWHGQLHDLSFVLLGLTLFPAMIVLGFAFRQNEKWKNLSAYTWATLALAAPAFALKGAAFYVFLLAILAWNEVVALRLNKT